MLRRVARQLTMAARPRGGRGRAAKGDQEPRGEITAAEVSQSPISELASGSEHHDNVIIGWCALQCNPATTIPAFLHALYVSCSLRENSCVTGR
jgi:hypothetical protein